MVDEEMGSGDLTGELNAVIKRSGISSGLAHLFVVGSTGALGSIEYEAGLLADLREVMRRLVPKDQDYKHELAWHDGNAHSHLRATMLRSDLMVPVTNGKAELGNWQQIAVFNTDTRKRERKIVITCLGE